MPSPIGHLIAGAAIGRAITPRKRGLVLLCAGLAAASDLDLLIPHAHRTVTHSIGAVALVTIVAAVVTGQVTSRGARSLRGPITLALGAAFASHLLLDWLAADPTPPQGVQLLWPFTNGWYISGLNLFRGTARRNLFAAQTIWINVTAIAQETAILGPIAWLVFRFRR